MEPLRVHEQLIISAPTINASDGKRVSPPTFSAMTWSSEMLFLNEPRLAPGAPVRKDFSAA
jgi:hypothetical protein